MANNNQSYDPRDIEYLLWAQTSLPSLAAARSGPVPCLDPTPAERAYRRAAALERSCAALGLDPEAVVEATPERVNRDELVSSMVELRYSSHIVRQRSLTASAAAKRNAARAAVVLGNCYLAEARGERVLEPLRGIATAHPVRPTRPRRRGR